LLSFSHEWKYAVKAYRKPIYYLEGHL